VAPSEPGLTRRRWLRRSFALPEKIPLHIDYLDIEINSVAKGGAQFNAVSSDISGAHLWLILMKSYRALSQVDARSIADSGLGMSDFAVLEVLLHKGPLPVNTIGGHVMLTSGSITTAIDRLEAKRLVRRKPCPEDRRVTYVSLTRIGSTLIRKIFKVHADRLEALFEPLTVTERASLGTLLKKIGRHAESLLSEQR
jgi:MarR family transcriptional regulator, 2-MHQ and catechol-resistance regulon repressor